MSSKAVSPNPAQHYLWHVLAMVFILMPVNVWAGSAMRGGGENLSYPVDKSEESVANNKTSATASDNKKHVIPRRAQHGRGTCCMAQGAIAVPKKNTSCCTELRTAQCSCSTHSSPHNSTANAAPTHNSVASATQALDKLEQKLDQRLRVAATHFANNAAQGFVQQSLPQMLLGGHWLTEKFQFLSTLAWQSGDDKGGILGELDLVVPLYGMRDAAGVDQYGFFIQPGLVSWEADNGDRRLDVNVGLVYRQRIREHIAVGAAVFYDHNIDSDLKRIGAGTDMVSRYTYLAVNYYEPLDGWRTGERLGYEERALRGVDVNIEQALWDSHWVLEVSGGYWKGYDSDNRQGEWQLAGSVGIHFYPLDYLSVYADYAYQHQDVDTDRFAAGIEFSYPGKHRGVSENEIDLWRPVKREKRILYAEREAFPTRIMVSASSETISINAGEYTPEQLQLTVAIDRALAADLALRFALLVNGQEITATGRLKNNGNAILKRGQTQAVITYSSADLGQLFGSASGRYVLQLQSALLKLPNGDKDVSFAIASMESGGQVMITVGEAGSASTTTPTLTLATDPVAVVAGNEISLTVTSDEVIAGTLTLPLTISGQVVAGDFTGGLTQSVNASFGGTTTATVTIATTRFGGTAKTYTITLGSGVGYIVGGDNTADGTINAATPTLTLMTDPAPVTAGNNISLEITSDIPVFGSLTVGITFAGTGVIVAGGVVTITASDIDGPLATVRSVSVNFNGGRTATVTFGTVRDADASDEIYALILSPRVGYILTGIGFLDSGRVATGTISP